ncbi:MAG: electron transport complex subunit RsxC [Alcanivoracaceae bacterium]|nr:electron transport complex subunit RsxC [Alcanivoracaceae bacterium]
MVNNSNQINANHLHSFSGGLKLKHHKNDSLQNGLSRLTLPEKLYISLRINRGNIAKPIVNIGDRVLKGQIIAKPDTANGSYIHASSSGTVTAIEERTTASPDADISTVIEISTDGKDEWIKLIENNILEKIKTCTARNIIDAIHDGGLVGLGGAGFPTHLKYKSKDNEVHSIIDTLIINGAECEPYITCDEQLMIDYPDDLINGTLLLMKASGASQAVLAIEDQVGGIKTRLEHILKLRQIEKIVVIKVPTIYPAGGEKQLIKVLTGQEVPSGGLPLDLGIIVQNVGTIKALSDFVSRGQPLVERVVTVAGDCIGKAQNFITAIGTPINHLLQQAQCDFDATQRLVIGGPMMGYAMPDAAIGIDKTSNCILALSAKNTQQHGETMPCIRCGECVNVCPAELLPQQLHWYINGGNLEKAREHHLFDCIECGACAWVCPSQIKLVDYYRYAKSELKYLDYKREKSDIAQNRHEQREDRLLRLKNERAAKRKRTRRRSNDPDKMKLDLQATLDRVNAAKKSKTDNREQMNESK